MEPKTEVQPPQMTIRLPARVGGGETAPTASTAAQGGRPEAAPPRYTEWVEPALVAIPRSDDKSANAEPEESREHPPEGNRASSPVTPVPKKGADKELRGLSVTRKTVVIVPGITQWANGHENSGPVLQEETQCVPVALDPEITGMIRRIAQDQRQLRTEVEAARRETFEVRVLVKTHKAWLNQVFKHIGDVINNQWALRAGMDELKQLQGAAGGRNRVTEPIQTPIKSEPVSPEINGGQRTSLELFIVMVSDIESLYASEGNGCVGQGQGQEHLEEQPSANAGQRQEVTETPGEAWIQKKGIGHLERQQWMRAAERHPTI